MIRSSLAAVFLLAVNTTLSANETRVPLQAWWVDSLQQVLVEDLVPPTPMPGELRAARGEYEAIQVAVRSPTACRVTLRASAFGPDLAIRIRTVGRVPIVRGTHHTPREDRVAEPPAELPDPLFPGDRWELAANRTECFWLDVQVPPTATPGEYRSRVEVISDEAVLELPLVLKIHQATVPFEGRLLLTNWFSVRPKEMKFGDSPPGSEDWWACANQLFDSMWDHRQNMFWTPLGPPFIQPVALDNGQLGFDFTLFDPGSRRFPDAAGASGRPISKGNRLPGDKVTTGPSRPASGGSRKASPNKRSSKSAIRRRVKGIVSFWPRCATT